MRIIRHAGHYFDAEKVTAVEQIAGERFRVHLQGTVMDLSFADGILLHHILGWNVFWERDDDYEIFRVHQCTGVLEVHAYADPPPGPCPICEREPINAP